MALATAIAVGCGTPPGPPPAGITLAIESAPQSLDPRFGLDAGSSRVADLLHVALTRLSPDGRRLPDLATGWSFPNDTTIVFTLRGDARFSDGTPVSASDVVATYEAIRDPAIGSPKRSSLSAIARVDAPNPLTVRFHLHRPFPPILDATGIGILPAAAAQLPDEAVVGAGPFRLERAEPGQRIELAANPHWPDGRPAVPTITLRVVPDPMMRALELDRGTLDLTQEPVEPEVAAWLVERGHVRRQSIPGSSFGYLAFNHRDARLTDRRVRRAIAHALDRRVLRTVALGDAGRLASGMLPPEHWAHHAVPEPQFDPARARRLLDRAGYRDPDGPGPAPRFRIVYKTTSLPARRRLAQVVQTQLANVGIAVDIRSLEWTTLFADIRAGRFDLVSLSWVGVADPDLYFLAHHSTMVPPEGYNRGHYRDPVMDRLVTRARHAADPATRARWYGRVQRRAAERLPTVPLWWEDRVVLHSDRITGFTPSPSGDLRALAAVASDQ